MRAMSAATSVAAAARRSAAAAFGRRQQRRSQGTKVESSRYFNKVLVANRAEIACRVFQTCKRLGIATVAVHSTPDQHTKFVRMADEAIHIGPAASADSYLRMDRVIEACKQTGADAVHPGYGFLSENAQFAKALAAEGITFIGPDTHAIDAMGDKIHSKKLAGDANVNIIPGFDGEIETVEQMLKVADDMGYPIMIKASAGGGGKGLRIAWNEKQARQEWVAAKGEAKASFGDDRMLVEKFIDDPRHIEIQIIADKCGNTLYLPERECSIQRRNQKVIEEAPSAFIDPETRKAMGEQAAQLARAVNYHTAGTVEMLVDSKRNFYFLEMNTRLQVEHPVTEAITGLDLVEEMLRAAKGLPLTVTQEDVKIHGWATECRVYAEDPTRNYAPSIGRLTRYIEPEGPGVRVDSGITEGSEISMYYDPMIAKQICWGKDRAESIERSRKALDDYVVRGLKHNIALMRDVLGQERYVSGNITTKYLPETYPEGFAGHVLLPEERNKVLATTAIMRFRRMRWYAAATGTIQKLTTEDRFVGVMDSQETDIVVTHVGDDDYTVKVGETSMAVSGVAWKTNDPVFRASFDGESVTLQLFDTNEVDWTVLYMGTPYTSRMLTPKQHYCGQFQAPKKHVDTSKLVQAPMPGAVVDVNVKVGDKVASGGVVCVLEAMKMQQALMAERDGVVKAVAIKKGDTVEEFQTLVEFE
eukprot:TRINITY_DN502_c0_g1_i2.p1 TRINITY_DN502_c0_g1~~TRINITY_DN502_c0_g1_i2.p1  ORF type:complete len:735 (+),score=278.22 TRINITY_DN502_c0_g1_i2:105-2207(+)